MVSPFNIVKSLKTVKTELMKVHHAKAKFSLVEIEEFDCYLRDIKDMLDDITDAAYKSIDEGEIEE